MKVSLALSTLNALLIITKLIVNAYQALPAIRTIDTAVRVLVKINAQLILIARKIIPVNRLPKAFYPANPFVISFHVVPMHLASLTTTWLIANVLQVSMPVIPMIQLTVANQYPVFIISIALQLNFAIDSNTSAMTRATRALAE